MRVSFQQALAMENVRKLISQSDDIITEFCESLHDISSGEDLLPYLMRLALERKFKVSEIFQSIQLYFTSQERKMTDWKLYL